MRGINGCAPNGLLNCQLCGGLAELLIFRFESKQNPITKTLGDSVLTSEYHCCPATPKALLEPLYHFCMLRVARAKPTASRFAYIVTRDARIVSSMAYKPKVDIEIVSDTIW